jgi:hypothetical protein
MPYPVDRQVTAAGTLQGFLDPTQDKKATYRSERESRMTTMENTTVTKALQNSDLEEFDPVILGGGTGSTIPLGPLLVRASASQ